jgi:hypothetical protein
MTQRRTIPLVRQKAAVKDCPLAPGDQASVQSRALHRACVIVGGGGPLAGQLGVSASDIRDWLSGVREVPHSIFLAAVEIILLHAAEDAARS